jgi:hypothetical protein
MKDKKTDTMEKENTNPIPAYNEPVPQKRTKSRTRKVIWFFVLILAGWGVYRVASFYIAPARAVQQIYLVPRDAVFIIQSNSPVEDWKTFSRSEPWQCLKQAPSFAEIARKAGTLDSVLQANKNILSLVGKRDLIISAHKVRNGFWDFLFILDLQKISEIDLLKDRIEQIYSLMDYKVTQRKYQDVSIIELKDMETRDILYTAFVDNHYIASYTSSLVEASIRERSNPSIGLDPYFIEANKQVGDKGLYRIYIQYAYLQQFLGIYSGKPNEFMEAISQSMAFAGLSVQVDKEKFEFGGYSFLKDTINPYVSTFLRSGKQEILAHRILSNRTAFYTHIGFDNPVTFINELENGLSTNHPALYKSYKSDYKKIESLFGISLADDLLGWMSGEFAVTELEPGLLGRESEMILAIRAKDMELAKEKMAFIEKKVRKRTPLNIKTVTYKNYDIQYVELKGFFALFFGKMFDKFEKPYYTYMEDYVVFSNKPSSLLSLIEDYEQGRTLNNEEGFKQVYGQVKKESSYFVYLNMPKFFPLLKPLLNGKTWTDVDAQKAVVYSFPYSGLQVIGEHEKATMQLTLNYHPYQEEVMSEDVESELEDEDDGSGQDEIDELHRFYAEKFQGNVYREFYSEGTLKSEWEIKQGKRHGKYREYYEGGELKIRGKYKKGLPNGTWKFYTEDGKMERKEKMNGQAALSF